VHETKRMKKTDPIDPSVYEGLAAFRLALRRFLAFSEAATSAAGVTAQQYQALLVVKTHTAGPIMIRDFAEQMLLQPHGAVQMIDRLVASALVERKHSSTDGRSVLVSLTVKGASVLEHLATQHVKELLGQEPLLAESLRRLRQMGQRVGPSDDRRRINKGRDRRSGTRP
jgi:DNA-binding MarR family transcriptional regulator